MRAETFLSDLSQRYREAGGASLDLLAQATAEALEEISETGGGERPLEERTNDELREILAEMDQPTSGNKAELIERIEAAADEQETTLENLE